MCCGLPLQANPPFISPLYVATILRQVASGMMALHSRGYLHRDLNPNNVLVYSLDANCITVKGVSLTTCPQSLFSHRPPIFSITSFTLTWCCLWYDQSRTLVSAASKREACSPQ